VLLARIVKGSPALLPRNKKRKKKKQRSQKKEKKEKKKGKKTFGP